MKSSGVVYEFGPEAWCVVPVPEVTLCGWMRGKARGRTRSEGGLPGGKTSRWQRLGLALLALALGGLVGPLAPEARLEAAYYLSEAKTRLNYALNPPVPLPPAVPVVFNPLLTPDGASIEPVDRDFSLIIPKIGVNARVLPSVNPAEPGAYLEALEHGVAHASTSFLPDQDGTVYLFSHSTNYEWFVRDLNAVFYLLKNLSQGDTIVVVYKDKLYAYQLTEKRVVEADQVSYLTGQPGRRSLILQTCWPPGSTAERLLIFADLIEEQSKAI